MFSKQSNPRNPAQFPSVSSKNSVLPIPNLPSELVTKILLKLPVKSLLQFRSVSKSRLSLISSLEFVKTHLLLSASNKDYTHHGVMFKVASSASHGVMDCSLSFLLHHLVTEAIDLDYPGKNPKDYPWLVGSVNRLICLAISLFKRLHDLFIWNPSIRKYNKLPSYILNRTCGYYLEEPGYSRFGFASDELQDDYKVVGIFPIYKCIHLCRVEVQIYSLRSNSWRHINNFQGRDFLHVSGKHVNGKLYWLENSGNISSIDLCNEKWTEIEKPFNFKEYGHFVLGVLGSDLSVLYNYTWCHADVWIMKEYGVKESCTKMFTIVSANDSMPHIREPPILVTNVGDILLEIGSHLGKYNPKDNSLGYLDVANFAPYIEAEIYVSSLSLFT